MRFLSFSKSPAVSSLLAVLLATALSACTPLAVKPSPAQSAGAPATTAAAEPSQPVLESKPEAQTEPVAAHAHERSTSAPVADTLPRIEMTGSIAYQLLLAEVALRRSQPRLALSAYADLAQNTKDPRILSRAVELAAALREHALELQLAELWVQADPESSKARQMLVAGLVVAGRLAEVEPHVAILLKKEASQDGQTLMRLVRSVAVSPQRRELAPLLDRMADLSTAQPEAHFVRAFAAFSRDDLKKAMEEVLLARQGRPGWEQAALFQAQLTEGLQGPSGLIDVLEPYLERYPEGKDARLQYARALMKLKRYPEARAQFQRLDAEGRIQPDVVHALAVLALQTGDLDEAETRFKSLLFVTESNRDVVRMALGQITEVKGKWDEAVQWYSAIQPGPQYVEGRQKATALLFRQKGIEAALTFLRASKAEGLEDKVQLALVESQLLRMAHRDKEAFKVLDVLLSQGPEHTDLLYESALLADKAGRSEVIEPRLRRLIQLKPDFAHAYNALGYTFAERGERLDEAEVLIRRALVLAPDDPFIVDSLAWVLYRRGDLAQARALLEKAMQKRADPEIAAHLGEVLWQQGDHTGALRLWDDAARQAPDNEALRAVRKKFQVR